MIKNFRGVFCAVATFMLLQLLLSSCADVRKTVYFADQRDSILATNNAGPLNYIVPNDILSISVSSLNASATAIFNTPNTTGGNAILSSSTNLQSTGYLVNSSGFIQFPVIGEIKVTGLTTDQLRVKISKELTDKKLLVDPIVTVRQLTFKVSVLGEVARPSVINVPSEKISLLEALGQAGDITIYGRKDNVMIIREEQGRKTIKRIDLNSSDLFGSKYYYLQSNDVVYVEANKAKVASASRTSSQLPLILGALSLTAIVVQIILRR